MRCLSRYLFKNSTSSPSHFCCCYVLFLRLLLLLSYFCDSTDPAAPTKKKSKTNKSKTKKSKNKSRSNSLEGGGAAASSNTTKTNKPPRERYVCYLDLCGSIWIVWLWAMVCISAVISHSKLELSFKSSPSILCTTMATLFVLLLSPVKPPRPKAK